MPLRVLIADDHRIFRESLRVMLETDPDVTVVGTAGSGDELLAQADATHPDVVCMDVMMPGLDGIEATRRLVADQPAIKVIGLSAYPDRHYVLAMLDAGARGYVTKNEAPEELRSAIRSVSHDQLYFCPEISGQLLDAPVDGSCPALCVPPDHAGELRARLPPAAACPPPLLLSPDACQRLREVIEGSSIATFAIDDRHRVTHWNRACETLTGIPAGDVLGTREHWRAFYGECRPVMADLVLDQAGEAALQRYYAGKYRRSALIPDAYEAEDFFARIGDQGAWLFFTAAPLRDGQGQRVGAIETLQDVTARHHAETRLKESEARYRQLSITDNLTGLFNSRHFHDRLKAEVGRAIRYSHPLSLLVLDVDDFKRYNDTYGHLEGDRVLRELACVIRNCPRLGDTGYRLGGEEFAVLLPDTELEAARLVAERLRTTFAAIGFHPPGGASAHATVSIGVTSYLPYEKFSAFVRRADTACYQAKHGGKNQVVVA